MTKQVQFSYKETSEVNSVIIQLSAISVSFEKIINSEMNSIQLYFWIFIIWLNSDSLLNQLTVSVF